MFVSFVHICRNYAFPKNIDDQRLQEASRAFAAGILSALKNQSTSPVYVNLGLDIWRYVTYNEGTASQHRGNFLFEKNDLVRFKYLPSHWWYFFNVHGEGCGIDFPIKVKPVLSWTPAHFVKKVDKLIHAPRIPIEKICITIIRRGYNMDNIN